MTIPYIIPTSIYEDLSRVPLVTSRWRNAGTVPVASGSRPLLKGQFPSSHDIPGLVICYIAMENPHASHR